MTQSFESHTITNAFQTQAATFCVIVSGVLASLAVSGIVTLLVSCLMIVLTVVSVIVSIAVPVCGFVVGLGSVAAVWILVGIQCLLVPALLARAYYTNTSGKIDSKFDTLRTIDQMKTYIMNKTSTTKKKTIKLVKKAESSTTKENKVNKNPKIKVENASSEESKIKVKTEMNTKGTIIQSK